jgi:hypothetical protein
MVGPDCDIGQHQPCQGRRMKTATVEIPISRAVLMIRSAISPRLAMRIFLIFIVNCAQITMLHIFYRGAKTLLGQFYPIFSYFCGDLQRTVYGRFI